MKNNAKKFSLLMAAASVCILALSTACSSVKAPKDAETMGVILPLSELSPDSETANSVKRGMMLAQKRINTEGGIGGKRLEIIFKDAGKDYFETGQTIRAMADSGIKFLHLGFTNQIIFEMPDLKDREDLLINYLGTYPPATVSNKNSVRIFLNGAQIALLMATAYENPRKEEVRVVILNNADNSCKSSADYLSFEIKDEKTKIYRDIYSRGEKNFEIFASQIMRLNAPYFFNYGYAPEADKLLSALTKAGYKGTFVSNALGNESGLAINGDIKIFSVKTDFELGKVKTSENAEFTKAYKAEYSAEPNWAAAYGYDSVVLFAKAMREANGDTKKAREFFLNKSFECAVGKITFDSMADSTSELSLERLTK